MSSIAAPSKRKPLPISVILVIAALAAGVFTVAIPAPQQPPGGLANAAHPNDPGAVPAAMPSFTQVATRLGDGIGEVAAAAVSSVTASR